MKLLKKIIAAAAAVSALTGTFAFSAPDRGETVTVIVEVKGDAVLEAEAAREMGFKLFTATDEAARLESGIKQTQKRVQSDIKKTVDRSAEAGYTYTHVFNGFSMDVHASDIDAIKALPEVRDVYISKTYRLYGGDVTDAPYLDSGCEMMNAGYMHELGYTGKGVVIAVIDCGFDVNHEIFRGAIEEPKLSKADIADKIKNESLSVESIGGYVSVNRVYHSEKIPYAFNYYTKDGDVYDVKGDHGQHVAGIAAGNNGTDPNGGKFVGTAPDAQLLIMAAGADRDIYETAELAAFDDAVKLGADVINASFGVDYKEADAPESKAVNTAVKAGVLFSTSAGNAKRGYDKNPPPAENIDYSAGGAPACITAATAVASADNTDIWTNTSSSLVHKDEVTMSSFSSWSTNSTLELKPEITAPGGSIYSSVKDDEYINKSGTSMAAPHMAGAAALMKEYINKNAESFAGAENPVQLIENLIMSSADVLIQDKENGIPYSPRLQGAGMVDLEGAVKTPVALIGDTYMIDGTRLEKSKISLKEIELDENGAFDLSFRARSFADTDVIYDSVTMTVITDSADGDGYVGDMKELTFRAALPESVTVPAGGEAEISVSVTLDKAELAENMKTFINGFFIDGFVFLETSDETDDIPQISIPFTGFYGGWDSAPALDKPYFSGESLLEESYMYTVTGIASDGSRIDIDRERIMGTNLFDSDDRELASEDFVGYSPNGDGNADIPSVRITPFRRLGRNDFSICDRDGNELITAVDMDSSGEYFYCDKFDETYLYFDKAKVNALPDGDYIFRSKTGFCRREPYEQNESMEFRFYLDREKPVITKYEKSADGKTLTVSATDNRHLMGIVMHGTWNGYEAADAYPVGGGREAECTFDIGDLDEGSLVVEVMDYAMNSAYRSDAELGFELDKASGTSYLFKAYNETGAALDAALTMALYSSGRLVGISTQKGSIPKGDSFHAFNMDRNTGYDRIKLFVWDSLNGMTPLWDAFEF